MGYNLNEKKTKVIRNNNRQLVTGVVVNKKINITKEYKRKIRQEMYYLKKYGIESHLKKVKQSKEKYLISLKGRINYCLSINYDNELKDYLNIINSLK